MNDLAKELMKQKAAAKRYPEFQEIQTELVHKLTFANMMVDVGRLSKRDLDEFTGHLAEAYIDAMPTEVYVELQKNGSFEDIEIMARAHSGERHSDDVRRDRKALDKKITLEALDDALSRGKIDSRRFNEEQRKLGEHDDDMTRRVTDADEAEHESIAVESLLGRLGSEETTPASADMNEFADGLLRDLHGLSSGQVSPAPVEGAPKDISED